MSLRGAAGMGRSTGACSGAAAAVWWTLTPCIFPPWLPQSGLALAAGQQKALPGNGTVGRYVIIYTGTTQQGTLGLDDVQVYAYGEPGREEERPAGTWRPMQPASCAGPSLIALCCCTMPPAETNAAANKAVTASGLGGLSSAASLQGLADNNASSCVVVKAAAADNPAQNGTAGACRLVARGTAAGLAAVWGVGSRQVPALRLAIAKQHGLPPHQCCSPHLSGTHFPNPRQVCCEWTLAI